MRIVQHDVHFQRFVPFGVVRPFTFFGVLGLLLLGLGMYANVVIARFEMPSLNKFECDGVHISPRGDSSTVFFVFQVNETAATGSAMRTSVIDERSWGAWSSGEGVVSDLIHIHGLDPAR